jgi:hypothetical protein
MDTDRAEEARGSKKRSRVQVESVTLQEKPTASRRSVVDDKQGALTNTTNVMKKFKPTDPQTPSCKTGLADQGNEIAQMASDTPKDLAIINSDRNKTEDENQDVIVGNAVAPPVIDIPTKAKAAHDLNNLKLHCDTLAIRLALQSLHDHVYKQSARYNNNIDTNRWPDIPCLNKTRLWMALLGQYQPDDTMKKLPGEGYMTQGIDYMVLQIDKISIDIIGFIRILLSVNPMETVAFQYQLLLAIGVCEKSQQCLNQHSAVHTILKEFMTSLIGYCRELYRDIVPSNY